MLLETLKNDLLAARKAHDKTETGLLTALVSEASNIGKNAGNRESTDAEVVSVIRKFLKNVEEMKAAQSKLGNEDGVAASSREIAVLEKYLPKLMSIGELTEVIEAFAVDDQNRNIGKIMGYLKANHAGLYDGKAANEIAKKITSG